MQRLLGPSILTLSLVVPTASQALGLGDIRVDSALHQPLVAQIELVGAADDELGRLRAAIANDELFRKYNLERAPFIFGTTVTVGRDAQGRPVLNMRSTENFTEPVVTLLVDLHTPNGELVREYTLFLDPAGLVPGGGSNSSVASNGAGSEAGAAASEARAAAVAASEAGAGSASRHERSATRAGSASHTDSMATTASVEPQSPGKTHKVARRDTLARIVTSTGARSRVERHRMMIAIYRANPAAFQGNFNRMHTGVTLTLPTSEQLAAISVEETNREYDAQMAAWRASRGGSVVGSVSGVGASSVALRAVGNGTGNTAGNGNRSPDEPLPTDPAALKQRIASLEQSLAQIQQQLLQPLPAMSAAATASAAGRGTVAPGASQVSNAGRGSVAPTASPASNASRASAASVASDAASASAAGGVAAATIVSGAAQAAPVKPTSVREAVSAAIAASAPAVRTAAATSVANAGAPSSASADEDFSEDEADDTPQPQHRALKLIATAIGAGLLFFSGAAWFFFRRRNAHTPYSSPKHDAAGELKDDTVDFIEPSPTIQRLPALVSAPAIGAAPANISTAEKAAANTTPAQLAQPAPATANDPKNESSWFEDSFSTPIAELLNDPTVNLAVEQTAELPVEPTVKLPMKPVDETADTEVLLAPDLQIVGDTVEQKFSFFNPEDSNNTEHVVMGSALNEPKPFAERRKNPVDVLRQAIEREPDRSDLRLKLLELYYTAAAQNRLAFLEATRALAKNEKLATSEDWERIADMGRLIAPDDELFTGDGKLDDKRVA